MEESKTYSTKNLPLAAVLYLKGFDIVNIDRTDMNRATFIFSKVSTRATDLFEDVCEGYFNETLMVTPRKFNEAMRTLREKLYNG